MHTIKINLYIWQPPRRKQHNTSLLHLAVNWGVFIYVPIPLAYLIFKIMIEFTILGSKKRMTLDLKDIRAVIEQNEGTKILFYYDLKLVEFVAEDYITVIEKITNRQKLLSYLKRWNTYWYS